MKGVLNDNRFAARLPLEVQSIVADCYLYAFRFIPGMYYPTTVLNVD